jgi:hypothetical protein
MADDYVSQLRYNDEQLVQRVARHDVLATPRTIDHSAYFRGKSSARGAAAELIQLGYSAEVSGRFFRWLLEAHRAERLDGDNPARFVCEVHGVVTERRGTYDGWGGKVCPEVEKPATPLMYLNVMPEGITRTPFGFCFTFDNGKGFAGISRNAHRRIQSHARLARQRGIWFTRVVTAPADGLTAEERQVMAQQLMNSMSHGTI